MGEVMVTYKIMTTGVDVDLDHLEKNIEDKIKSDRINREPIAFGLTALKVIKIIPDDGNIASKIEEEIKTIEGVAGVEITELTKTL